MDAHGQSDSIPEHVPDGFLSAGSSSDPSSARLQIERDAIAELAGMLLKDMSLDDVASRVVKLAAKTVGADDVSITLLEGDSPVTSAATGQAARSLDLRQYALGSGPCVDAARDGDLMLIVDGNTEQRWPEYMSDALAAGVLSSLSVPLAVSDVSFGSLNCYSQRLAAFDEFAISLASMFAAFSAVTLTNASDMERSVASARQMQEAMASRAVIEQAKGIVMLQNHCTSEVAFGLMSKTSQDTNVKIRDVAAQIVTQAQTGP